MRKLFFISIFVLTFYSFNFAQSKAPGPNDSVRACGKIIFKGHPVEMMNVRSGIESIKKNGKCKKGILYDEQNKPVKIIQNYCEPGVPPRSGDGREQARQARQAEIEKSKKKYRVITYNCYPPRP